MEFCHKPVLLEETIDALDIKKDGIYIDGTAGGGGHSEQIAKRLESGRLISIDRDPDALNAAAKRLSPYPQARVIEGNFSEMKQIAEGLGINEVDGILLDIGVSSYQLDAPERGFSFHNDAPLDMRMSKSGPTAADLVAELSENELSKIFFEYGEEQYSRRIAAAIVREREKQPIVSTLQLAEIISESVPAKERRKGHPARQSFQALRIAVNGELDALSKGLDDAKGLLKIGGVLAVITFHSLEDRMVKQRFTSLCKGCTCPPDFPVCVCGKVPFAQPVFRRPKTASEQELSENPRSRSAKLRAIRRIN